MSRRFSPRSLVTRLVGVALLLMLLVQVVGFAVVRASIDGNARRQVVHELDVAETVWQRLLAQNTEKLRQGSMLLAADFGFRSAVSSGDAETMQSVLENHGNRIGATLTAFLGPDFAPRAVSLPRGSAQPVADQIAELSRTLAANPAANRLSVVHGEPYQFVLVPMRAPVIVGWVLMGFPLTQPLAEEMKLLLSVDVAVLSQQGAAQSVSLSTLPAAALAALRSDHQATRVEVDGEELLVRRVVLPSQGGRVETLLLRSVAEVVAPYRQLQVLLALITVLGLLLVMVGSGLMARRVATVLQSLIHATQSLASGRYDEPLAQTGRRDEIGQLSRAFDHMRVEVGRQQEEITRLAYWDRLTGLPNRERFRSTVVQAIEAHQREARPLVVLTLDLDRFKHVNDVLGYAYGDLLLKAVAERLHALIESEGDMVARIGGNEFAVLLQGQDGHGGMAFADRIAWSFEVPLALEDQLLDLSAGIGVASYPTDALEADPLLSRAEIAMFAAKRKTAGALFYDPSLDSASAQTLSLLSELRRAVEQGELRLYLQPKIGLQGRSVAAEALVRWQHPTRGLVPPMQFIPFAEQTGFVRQLTMWMFEEAVRLLADPGFAGQGLRISINLSTRDLLDPELSTRLGSILAHRGVSPAAFCLEITESAIMDDPQRAEAMLNRLSEQGFKLSIDDFGTGYSSLAYLKRLPVDELKIDKSFVMAMEQDEDDAKIVRSTVDLAHNLGLSVVAEGVENGAILERLRELSCDEAQGYHISRPMPAADFLAWRQGRT